MSNNFVPPGFNGDDYDEEEKPMTAAQIAARDEAWPELAESEAGTTTDIE